MSHERTIHGRTTHESRPGKDPSGALDVGDEVEVFSGYERTWSTGFSIAQVLRGRRYRLRRGTDGALLPDPTGSDDLRRLRHPGPR
jgi:hypothetical protein